MIRVERYDARESGSALRRPERSAAACFVGLPGSVAEGGFSPFDSRVESERLSASLRALANSAVAAVGPRGVVLFYGAPEWVTLALAQCPPSLEARAWIAVACRPRPGGGGGLGRSHTMLAIAAERGRSVDFEPVRVPHRRCSACGESLRDWGGRHARMRADGARLSDVWADLDVDLDDAAPDGVLGRAADLLGLARDDHFLAVTASGLRLPASQAEVGVAGVDAPFVPAGVAQGDCLELLRSTASDAVDLAFADPPYNLEKPYASARDRRPDYVGWCHAWLTEYARVVRPGGTLAILTLPRWASAHARFLLRHRALRFDRWVVWDALAEPKGRGLMPAHYALLLFTKGAARRPQTRLDVADPRAELCRRATCVAARVPAPRVALADVWSDIPRVRHARMRDAHPCQLPRALVERVVALASPPGGVVLDAFCGTGTTGAAALALARRPVLSDVSPEYVALAREKLRR